MFIFEIDATFALPKPGIRTNPLKELYRLCGYAEASPTYIQHKIIRYWKGCIRATILYNFVTPIARLN